MQLNKENRRINEKLCSDTPYNLCKSERDDYSCAMKFDLSSNRRWQKKRQYYTAAFSQCLTWAVPLPDTKTESCDSRSAMCERGGKEPSVTSCFYSVSAVAKAPSFFFRTSATCHIRVWGEKGVAQSKRTEHTRGEAAGLKQGQRGGWDDSAEKVARLKEFKGDSLLSRLNIIRQLNRGNMTGKKSCFPK